MKIFRTIACALALAVSMSVLCCGCGSSTNSTRRNRDRDNGKDETVEAPVALPKNETIAIFTYDNYAEGYQCRTTFIRSDGNVYRSEEMFSGYGADWNNPLPDEQKLAILMKYAGPVMRIDESDLTKIYSYMQKIDPNSELKYDDDIVYDAGCGTTSVLVNGEWVKISESGVKSGLLEDCNANKVKELLKEAMSELNYQEDTHVFSSYETFIDVFPCSGSNSGEPRRVITNMNELKAFQNETGIDLKSLESFEYFGDSDYDAFRSCSIAVEFVECSEGSKPSRPDAFLISKKYTGFAFAGDEPENTGDGNTSLYCYVAQVPHENEYYSEFYDMFRKGN